MMILEVLKSKFQREQRVQELFKAKKGKSTKFSEKLNCSANKKQMEQMDRWNRWSKLKRGIRTFYSV